MAFRDFSAGPWLTNAACDRMVLGSRNALSFALRAASVVKRRFF